MQYLIATYWMWFVVALLAGCAVGYWLQWRLGPHGGSSRVLRWGTAVFLIGIVVAILHWLPRRAGLYLETLLLLSFWYAIGGLLGALLRASTSGAEASGGALSGNVSPEATALAARAGGAVRSAQSDAPASSGTIEDARLAVEARAADVTRVAAAAKAREEDRVAAEARAAEKARVAAAAKAAEDARLAVEAKAAELARIAAAARAADEVRRAAETKADGEARGAAAAKAADDARLAAAAKAAEVARAAAAAKAADGARLAAAAKAAEEEARAAAAAKAADGARLAAAAIAAEEARAAAAAKAADDARLAAAAKATEEAGGAAAAKAKGAAKTKAAAKAAKLPGVASSTAGAAEAASHPGNQPPGIAAPADGETDDLKLIKGIGPKNETACHALGIYWFGQIADWTPDEAIWVGHHMAFPGRIEREHWIAQARLLTSGGETEHSRAVKSGSLVVDASADEPLDQASADALAKSLPAPAAAVEGEDKHAGRRPYGLASAVGAADNLKKIRGIGPQNERRLHALGIWHFSQIAAWSEDNVKWVGSYLAFAGRIDREKWIAQARDLAAGKDTEFSRRVAAGKVATSNDDGASG